MANITGSMVLLIFNVMTTMWSAYSFETITVLETNAYGSITPLGLETRQVGPTSLTINGTRYTGSDPTEQSQVTVDAWFAPTQNGHITIELAITSISGGETVISGMKVVSITLTEDQIVSETPDDTTGDDTTRDDSSSEENQSGGGIPGFQYEPIIAGLAIATVLYYMRKH